MQLVFTDLGPIFIVVFAAMLLAEETGTGTIRAALAAPVHRWEFYLAKAVIGLLYMMVLSAAALPFSARAGLHPLPFRRGGRFRRGSLWPGPGNARVPGGYALSWIPLGPWSCTDCWSPP